MAFADQLAMFIINTGQISPRHTRIRNHDASIAHVNKGFRDHLHGGKEAIDIVGAFNQHLQLPTTIAASLEKAIGILEVVVIGVGAGRVITHRRRNDFALRQ